MFKCIKVINVDTIKKHVISRAHSFSQATEFRAEPQNFPDVTKF